MSGYLNDDQGYQPVKKPVRTISMRTAVVISLVTGVLIVAIWYLGAQ